MELSILTNDEAKPGFFFEHGLSVYIQHQGKHILFDTGYTDVYLKNARKLGIDFITTDYIVLSHGHYDHTGGLRYFISNSDLKEIIIHKDAFNPKYAKENYLRFNGIPFNEKEILWANKLFHKVEDFYKIDDKMYVLGNIQNDRPNRKYYVNQEVDQFYDEIILILEEQDELTLFLGCSHFGVKNGIEKVKKLFPNKKIKTLLAGMHSNSWDDEQIEELSRYLETIHFDVLIPLHCTGQEAMLKFKEVFKEKCILLKAGDNLHI